MMPFSKRSGILIEQTESLRLLAAEDDAETGKGVEVDSDRLQCSLQDYSTAVL